jgi:hypothetical protein
MGISLDRTDGADEVGGVEDPVVGRAFRVPDLRPYLHGGHAVRALGTGSVVLSGRLWQSRRLRRLLTRSGVKVPSDVGGWITAGLVGFVVAVVVWHFVGPHLLAVLGGGTTVWVVLALMHGHPPAAAGKGPATRNDHEMDAGEQSPEHSDPAAEEDLAEFVEHALAVAKSNGHHGVHLSTLLHTLHHHGAVTNWTVPDLGARLRSIGLPLRDVRVGTRNRVGIHHDDLRKHLGRTPRTPPHMVPDLTRPDTPVQAPAGAP